MSHKHRELIAALIVGTALLYWCVRAVFALARFVENF